MDEKKEKLKEIKATIRAMRDDYDKNIEEEFKKRLQVEINIRSLKKEMGHKEVAQR